MFLQNRILTMNCLWYSKQTCSSALSQFKEKTNSKTIYTGSVLYCTDSVDAQFSWYFQLVRNFIPPLWADRERGTNNTNCLQKPALIGSATTWFILHHRLHLSLVLTLVIVNELQNINLLFKRKTLGQSQNKGRNASIKVNLNLNWYLN